MGAGPEEQASGGRAKLGSLKGLQTGPRAKLSSSLSAALLPQPPLPLALILWGPLSGKSGGVSMESRVGTDTSPFLFEVGVRSLLGDDIPGPAAALHPASQPLIPSSHLQPPRPFGWGGEDVMIRRYHCFPLWIPWWQRLGC